MAEWPQSLRTTISLCLASDLPICVTLGPGLVQMYNDAYQVIIGDKHPRWMEQNFSASGANPVTMVLLALQLSPVETRTAWAGPANPKRAAAPATVSESFSP